MSKRDNNPETSVLSLCSQFKFELIHVNMRSDESVEAMKNEFLKLI